MTDSLVAVPLARWTDPADVHGGIFARAYAGFWLDAGARSEDGWSFVGEGAPVAAEEVRPVRLASGVRTPWPAGPFRGGWVGWFDYEDAAARAGAPVHRRGAESALWIRATRWVAFDHTRRRAWAVAPASEAAALATRAAGARRETDAPASDRVVRANARHAPDEYAALIESARGAIREGDAYQLCLTTRFDVAGGFDRTAVYARLRAAHPAHHGGLVWCAGRALASASPERFLEVADGRVSTSPIKGTRGRGATAEEDAALIEELRTSEKERAENIMIVDLMRNDLSRVCTPGSVGVDALLEVESYPAVHQLVSTVSGRLAPGITVGDLLDAAFPAGSMTGAPKLSAMTILHDLEGASRGAFAGCFGWVGDDGTLDLAMVIRSIVLHEDGAYVGAGGGITWKSAAWEEVGEVALKARGPLAALGAGLPAEWARVEVR
jgi:para-aminobenzoate synthetase component 1